MSEQARTRILFVDDEPMILEVLRLTIDSPEGPWDAAFANSGDEALAMMAQRPFEIVISDMRMPRMSGAQLLNEIMKRYPATVRIILSGYSDEDLVFKCVGSTHQFLGKPFQLKALMGMLDRVKALKQRLQNPQIRALLTRATFLPGIPGVYFKILDAVQKPEVTIEEIGEIVATDPALSARLLQLINSAFFGFAREVSSVNEAVMLLGVGTIRSLALSTNVFSAFEVPAALKQVWDHSMRVACLAQKISRLERADQKLGEQAFTAGLLHDIGKLLLGHNLRKEYLGAYERATREKRLLLDVEREVFHAAHPDVGAYLLDLWGLPGPLVEAVALHDAPALSDDREFSALTAVHGADVLVRESQAAGGPEQILPAWDTPYLQRLGLEARVEAWRAEANSA